MDELYKTLWEGNLIKNKLSFMITTISSDEKIKKVWGMEDIKFTVSENNKLIPHKNKHVYETAVILTTLLVGLEETNIAGVNIIVKKPFINLFNLIVEKMDKLWEQEIETSIPEELNEIDIYIEHPWYPESWFRPK